MARTEGTLRPEFEAVELQVKEIEERANACDRTASVYAAAREVLRAEARRLREELVGLPLPACSEPLVSPVQPSIGPPSFADSRKRLGSRN